MQAEVTGAQQVRLISQQGFVVGADAETPEILKS